MVIKGLIKAKDTKLMIKDARRKLKYKPGFTMVRTGRFTFIMFRIQTEGQERDPERDQSERKPPAKKRTGKIRNMIVISSRNREKMAG